MATGGAYELWLSYLGAYRLALGAFLALASLAHSGTLSDLFVPGGEGGLVTAFLRLLSLAGRPPTIGFLAKVVVLSGAVASGLLFLPLVLVLRAGGMLYAYTRLFIVSASRGGKLRLLPIEGHLGKVSSVAILVVRRATGLWLCISVSAWEGLSFQGSILIEIHK